MSFDNWAVGSPSGGECVSMSIASPHFGMWKDVGCRGSDEASLLMAICEKGVWMWYQLTKSFFPINSYLHWLFAFRRRLLGWLNKIWSFGLSLGVMGPLVLEGIIWDQIIFRRLQNYNQNVVVNKNLFWLTINLHKHIIQLELKLETMIFLISPPAFISIFWSVDGPNLGKKVPVANVPGDGLMPKKPHFDVE